MKTEFEKMRGRELYCFSDPEIMASLGHANDLCRRLRGMTMADADYRAVIEELIPGIPPTSTSRPRASMRPPTRMPTGTEATSPPSASV